MYLINQTSVSVSTSISAKGLAVCWSGAFRCELTQWRGGKNNDLKEAFVSAHRSGKGYKSKLAEVHHFSQRKSIHK